MDLDEIMLVGEGIWKGIYVALSCFPLFRRVAGPLSMSSASWGGMFFPGSLCNKPSLANGVVPSEVSHFFNW